MLERLPAAAIESVEIDNLILYKRATTTGMSIKVTLGDQAKRKRSWKHRLIRAVPVSAGAVAGILSGFVALVSIM